MRSLSLRSQFIGVSLVGILYVLGGIAFLALGMTRASRDALEGTERLAGELEGLGQRADSLAEAVVALEGALQEGAEPWSSGRTVPWVESREALALEAVASVPGLPPPMRLALAQAADLESRLVGLLNETLAQRERGLLSRARETIQVAEATGRELNRVLAGVQIAGFRHLFQKQEAALRAARRLRTLTILWAFSTALLALAALVWFHVRVRAPLRGLEEGVSRVGAGRFDEPVQVLRRDELGRLAEILNWAAAGLRERAEAQTRVTRSLMERVGRLMEDSAREIYIFHGVDLHLVQMNGTLRKNLQWEDSYGEATPFDFILTPQRDGLRRDLDRLRRGQIVLLPFSVRHRRRNGTEYPVEGNFQYSGDEEPPVFVAVARDMTEIYEREDQLRQAMRMQAVGQLTGGVAHDFNNLLTVIQGGLELIREDMDPDDSDLPLVEEALAAAERGGALTHQLLAFSRSQALRPQVLELNDLLGETERMLSRTLGDGVDLRLMRSAGLWYCQADPAEVKNVVLNLVLNARDAMPLGGRITIETANTHLDAEYAATVEELQPGEYVMIAVTDSGRGMSPEILARAFEPFFTTKGVGQGSGLGLSMAFGFAKQSGGHIRLESEVGKGTTARLYLPRVRAEQMELEGMEPYEASRLRGPGDRIGAAADDPAAGGRTSTSLSLPGPEGP